MHEPWTVWLHVQEGQPFQGWAATVYIARMQHFSLWD